MHLVADTRQVPARMSVALRAPAKFANYADATRVHPAGCNSSPAAVAYL